MKVLLQRMESKASLIAHLQGRISAPLILGEGCEAAREFWSVSLPESSTLSEFGIISSGFGIKPSALYVDLVDSLFVGHDCTVSVISLQNKSICHKHELDGVFFEFLRGRESIVVAIHELGAASFDVSGRLIWTFSAPDIVTGWNLTVDHLVVHIEGSDDVAVNLDTGLQSSMPT